MRRQAGAPRDRRAGERAPVPRRGDGRAAAVARQPGERVRRGPAGRPDLPGDGLRRRARPARGLEPLRRAPHALPGRHRGLRHQGAVPRPRLRARFRGPAAGASRRVAWQRAAVVFGRGEADRFRAGDVDAEAGEDVARNHLRQAQLPGARAGAARAARRAHRSLRRRDPAVGAADRPPAVPGRPPGGRIRRRELGRACTARAIRMRPRRRR